MQGSFNNFVSHLDIAYTEVIVMLLNVNFLKLILLLCCSVFQLFLCRGHMNIFFNNLLFYNALFRDDSCYRGKFIERLIEDRSESALSYYEFLQHLKSNVKWWKKIRYYVICEMCSIYIYVYTQVVCRGINSCCWLKLKVKLKLKLKLKVKLKVKS